MNTINDILQKLAEINEQKKVLESAESALRANVFEELKKNDLDSYKGDFGTASRTRRKKVIVDDEEKIIAELKRRKLKDCYTTKTMLTGNFTKQVESGDLEIEGVQIVVSESLMIRL